jgi:hypothetical protein
VVISDHCMEQIDMGPRSLFRFLVKTFLWWDTLSKTEGVKVEEHDTKVIFDTVHQWEEDENVLDSCQCITGWPLSLLEAVAQLQEETTKETRNDLALLTIKAQIQSCRPRMVPQDNLRNAELRFIYFEILMAGALVYFHRVVYGHCNDIQNEVSKVVRFLGKREKDRVQNTLHSNRVINNNSSKRQDAESWKDRAPDGALIWAYFQVALTMSEQEQQEQCEKSIDGWIKFNDCAALNIAIILLKAMWSKTREGTRKDLNESYQQVCKERRWTQPLVF